MACADSALAHRMTRRVFDEDTGRSFRTELRHRHTGSGRVVLVGNDGHFRQSSDFRSGRDRSDFRSWRDSSDFRSRRDSRINVLGAPVVTYRTYTTSDPYSRGGYRYDDRDGYRYYRDTNGSVLGRVLQGVVQDSVQRR